MSVAIIDVREWQSTMDLKSGDKVERRDEVTEMVRAVLKRHPFPGDTAWEGNPWVTDMTLDLVKNYDPRFVFLSYSQQYFSRRFLSVGQQEWQDMCHRAFDEMERFVREGGYTPVVVGSGDMVPVEGVIDLSRLDGLGVCSHWATHYGGLYGASEADLVYVNSLPQVERVVKRAELLEELNGPPGAAEKLPEYLVVAKEGWCFRTPGLRRPVMIPGRNRQVPVHLPSGQVAGLTDLADYVMTRLKQEKVALIMMEGIGMQEFRLPFQPCVNGVDWYDYEPGEGQFLAVTQGRHQMFDWCPGYRYYRDENTEYPFSGYFQGVLPDTIGKRFSAGGGGRSVAVGNRSMFMHTLTGTDISVECFARNLNNQGCMAVIHS